jgi:hypothetical protein
MKGISGGCDRADDLGKAKVQDAIGWYLNKLIIKEVESTMIIRQYQSGIFACLGFPPE